MIHPSKLMRGVILAVALLSAPMVGGGLPLVGVEAAHAQQQGETLVASVLFEGNRRFTDEQLLTMVDTATRGIYTSDRLNVDIESIRQAYDTAGFQNVRVTARTEPVQNGRVRVVFVINEGERAGIAAINFTGNNSVNNGTLEGVIATKESGILSFLFRDDIYDEQKLAADRELIRTYYANRGFPDTQVTSVADYDPQRNAYFINFTINEGERYNFGNVAIETSIGGLNATELRGYVRTREGSRYSQRDLQRSTEDLAFQATAQGFSFADVRPRINRDPANRLLNVTYLVDEGARIYVERINITGNEKTRDFVIRRELGFGEGDPFNRSLVTRARNNVQALGFFSAVELTAEPGSAADRVVLNINVTEQSTGDYGVTAGYSTSDGILGEVSLTERNFLGRGQYLRVALGASESGKTFDLSFTEPRFMGLNVSAGIDVYHRINDENSYNYYGSTATGGQVRFGVPITADLSSTVFVGGEHKVVADVEDPFSQVVADGATYDKAFVGYSLTYNGVDNVKRPTEGLYATFTQQYVGWGYNHVRTEARARYFMPLLEDSGIIGSVRGTAGVINNLSDGEVNSVEAFNVGSNLVRGFESRGFGPRLQAGEAIGATMYAGLSAEVEFPIPVLPENYGLRGAVFADAGYVGGEPGHAGGTLDLLSVDSPLRSSVGASLIWDSPFGPLRGDFAYVLNKSTADKPQVFQLTLSTLL